MAWKKVSNADAGDATHFGGDDFDKVADLFSDVVNVDTVQINSTFELIASKFKIRDLTDETKELVFDVSAILTATTRTIIWPDSNLNFGSFPIANLDTDPLARANHTGTQLASTISDFDTQVRTSRLDQMASATSLITVAGIIETGRSQYDKGVDVASTTDMTLGIDGNVFDITGAVTIDHILNTNWQIGSVIVLHFVSTPTLTHNAGAEVGDEASLFLQGDSNFSASTGDILTFVLLESIQWQEISRNVAGAGAGDMILADAQTNTGIKTFLDTTMKLRNVANTFDAFFVNTVTADRIYTLPDAAGSIVITGLASQITIGTEVTGTSTALTDTGDIAYLNTPNTFIAGNLNTFSHDATNPGLSVLPIAGDPSARADGAIWLNVTSQQLFARINGSDVDLGAGAGGGEANDLQSLGGGTSLTAAVSKSGIFLQTVSVATTAPLTHSVTTDLLTFDINDLVNADISATAAIVLTKLQNIATARLLGRQTAASGAIEEISLNATLELVAATTIQRAALTGDITASAGSNATLIASNIIDDANIATGIFGSITGIGTQAQALLMGGFGVTNIGTAQADILEIINAGAGANPQLDSNNAGTELRTNSRFEIRDPADLTKTILFRSQSMLTGTTLTIAVQAITSSLQLDIPAINTNTAFAITDFANAWGGGFNQNITGAGKWQEGGVSISPIGIHDVILMAGNYIERATNPPATSGLQTRELPTNDVNISYWEFTNAGGIQGIQSQFSLPRNFNNTNISIRIYWTCTGATTGDVAWKVRLNAFSDNDPLDAAFAAEVEITDTFLANDDVHIAAETTLTVPAWVDADFAVIQIERDPADAQDTIDDTAVQFLESALYITTDAAVIA